MASPARRYIVGFNERRHGRLWYRAEDPAFEDRDAVVREALAELLCMRERERERQADRRRDRHRARSRRALGAAGALGLTTGEVDEQITDLGTLTQRALDAAIADLGRPIDADVRARAAAILERDRSDVAAAAWSIAFGAVRWSRADWEPGRLVLSALGMRKLAWVKLHALRWCLAVRAGYGSIPLANVDGLWIVLSRIWLSDDEIGFVLAAADLLGPGRHSAEDGERMLEKVAVDGLARHRRALAHWPEHLIPEKAALNLRNELARHAHDRWQRLRREGWNEVRRRPATRRT